MKKLIIVCEEETRKYGDFLAQLVSLRDDEEDKIVGVPDGEVAAIIWTEKEYKANAVQISSEQYIIFIGNSNLMKSKREHMNIKYQEHGINYGWLGKQATLFVDGSINFEEYTDFIEFAQSYKPDLKTLVSKKLINTNENEETEAEIAEIKENTAIDAPPISVIDSVKQFFVKTFEAISEVAVNVVDNGETTLKMAHNAKKIKEQQYSCAILFLYLNDLKEFLEF